LERTRLFLQRTGALSLIVDGEGEKTLVELIESLPAWITVVLPERSSVSDLQQRSPQHRFWGSHELSRAADLSKCTVQLDAAAYVLFTSGSTGDPKGVVVAHRNISHLLRSMVARHAMNERDRVSQFADLTFDPSVYDVFAAWECGACVCCPDTKALFKPAPFLVEQAITIFQSVPSNGHMMKRLGALKSGRFPDLRVTLFGGEALPLELCRDWQVAAPNSIIENLYGPTEVTINSTAYRWDKERSPGECENGIVPIGPLLPGVRGLVADEQLKEVPDGEKGELLLAGPQRTLGYLNDPERTQNAMVTPPGKSEIYYRTGDLVRKPAGRDYYFFYGRSDFQVKVFGMRIELGEIEAALREATGVNEVAAIGWPLTPTGAGGIVAFVGDAHVDLEKIRQTLSDRLPLQMVPREIRLVEKLPLNNNGKVDRLALRSILESKI
jgi:amino acid adenylation domain-containing protein